MKKILIIFFCVLLLILVFFPKILSVGFGKKIAIKAFDARLHGEVQIESLSLSWFGPQKIEGLQFSRPDVSGSLEELQTAVPLWSFSSNVKGPFFLKNGTLSFKDASRIEQVNGQVENQTFSLTGITRLKNQTGSIEAQGTFESLQQFDLSVDLKNFPSAALDALFPGNSALSDLLGPSFNLSGPIANPGKVVLRLASDNGSANLYGKLSSNLLTLDAPLTASFGLTEGLSKKLLRNVNPLFLTSISSNKPILLRISSQGFSCPLFPFSFEKLSIGEAVLDLGQTRCRIGKSLASIFSLLNAPATSGEISAWFTPLSFSLNNQQLHTGRMDALLANSLHICTWGDIDLKTNRLHLFLGLTADALRQAFGIQNLSDRFVLKVPITGTIQDPEIEKGAAAAKIAAMVAGQKIPKKGEIFGGLVNQFIQVQEEKGVPPAKRPFPWE